MAFSWLARVRLYSRGRTFPQGHDSVFPVFSTNSSAKEQLGPANGAQPDWRDIPSKVSYTTRPMTAVFNVPMTFLVGRTRRRDSAGNSGFPFRG